MKKGLFLITAVALLVFASCNKNQKAVKTLDGSWELVSTDGVAVTDPDDVTTVTYSNCKLKKDEYCEVTTKDSDGTETAMYKVEDDGETLIYKVTESGISIELKSTIDELTDDKLVITTDFLGLGTIKSEYKKV